MKIRARFQVLFLVFVVLGVYYPTLFGGFNSVDDWKLVTGLENQTSFSLAAIFKPGSSFYYRPLLKLTYMADGYLWGCEPSFMHLENILIHLCNSLLVFWIARKVCAALGVVNSFLPLVAGLFFALHPINTESVNWISGRTDPLGTLFTLAAFGLLISAVEKGRIFWGGVAGLVFLAGIMSKEMVLFFLPAALFLAWRWPVSLPAGNEEKRTRFLTLIAFFSPYVVCGLLYLWGRIGLHGAQDKGVHFILDHYNYDVLNTLRVVCKVFGFYVKKLFVPVPLNFAIVSVDDHYVWFGVTALAVCGWLVSRRRLEKDLLAVSFYLILPAIVIALTHVAWTPLAERYLYLPSAFFTLGMVGQFHRHAQYRPFSKATWGIAVLILTFFVVGTTQRNILWQDTLQLYEDTVAKTPDFAPVRNELALALLKHNRKREANDQLEQSQALAAKQGVRSVFINKASLAVSEGRCEEARELLRKVVKERKKVSTSLLKDLIKVNEAMLLSPMPEKEKKSIREDLLQFYVRLYSRNHDPFIRYRAGIVAMFLGRNQEAAVFFREAYRRAPEGAHYRAAAAKLAEKCNRGTPIAHERVCQ